MRLFLYLNFSCILCLLLATMSMAQVETTDRSVVGFKDKLNDQGVHTYLLDLRVNSTHYTAHNGVQYMYLSQYWNNLEIFNASASYLIHQDQITITDQKLIVDLDQQNLALLKSKSTPELVLRNVLTYLNFPVTKLKTPIFKIVDNQYGIVDKYVSRDTIHIELGLFYTENEGLQLAWKIDVFPRVGIDDWTIIVADETELVLHELNHTKYCSFDNHPGVGRIAIREKEKFHRDLDFTTSEHAAYHVIPPPFENPLQASQTTISGPSDPVASPFGWHDVNGLDGAEYFITRGNNAHAFQDTSDLNESMDDEPFGGQDLQFIFPLDLNKDPIDNIDADVTNLFFWNNYVHDWVYQFGFTEETGNFQAINYGKGGEGKDFISAQALDGEGVSNAVFSSRDDGEPAYMQMYRWLVGSNVEVTEPLDIAGFYPNGIALFGPTFSGLLSGQVALVNDENGDRNDACEVIQNVEELRGNIALINRGTCHFSAKVVNAQDRGAIACIICNNVDGDRVLDMSGGDFSEQVEIPSFFLSKEDCQVIKNRLITSDVHIRFGDEVSERSSSLDNAVIVHEYAHGITDRLTGGKANSSCLNNDEQAGEGWSDFFAMVLTHPYKDRGADHRSIAGYLLGQDAMGRGIRRYPYSTDLRTNPQTLSHVRNTQSPHALGEIWASVLWDLYWSFIDQYGYDSTWTNPQSGNHIAIQLVIDALMIQPCNPSLLESRDAIITADMINHNGIHQCEIWRVFAKRGFGNSADIGDLNNRGDNKDGFDMPLSCDYSAKIIKETAETFSKSDVLDVKLTVRNDSRAPLIGLTLYDEIPEGMRFLTSTSDYAHAVNPGSVVFTIEALDSGEVIEIMYKVIASGVLAPEFSYFEGFEFPAKWSTEYTGAFNVGWVRDSQSAHKGMHSGLSYGVSGAGSSILQLEVDAALQLDRPGLKFWQRYNLELGSDGGVVEVSNDNGITWTKVPDDLFLVNGYSDQISYDQLHKVTETAFSGEESWHPVIIDLSDYKGDQILIRFRQIGQESLFDFFTTGWRLDDIEIFNIIESPSVSILKSGDEILTRTETLQFADSFARLVPEESALKEAGGIISFPNPTSSFLYFSYITDQGGEQDVSIKATDGSTLLHKSINSQNRSIIHEYFDVSSLPQGTYILHIQHGSTQDVQRFIKL